MKAIFVDWLEERKKTNWQFVGREALENQYGTWSRENPDGVQGYDGYPAYNYAYILESDFVSKKDMLRVIRETSCTVVRSNRDGRYYLALTGGGMDMTQDIALAYMIVDGCIERDLMMWDMQIGGPISVRKEDFISILKKMDHQLDLDIKSMQTLRQKVTDKLLGYEQKCLLTERWA